MEFDKKTKLLAAVDGNPDVRLTDAIGWAQNLLVKDPSKLVELIKRDQITFKHPLLLVLTERNGDYRIIEGNVGTMDKMYDDATVLGWI